MRIVETKNSDVIARLNEHVHKVHTQLYPEYFKEYNYVDIKKFFDTIIHKEQFIFLLIEEDDIPIGYSWLEIKEFTENAFKKSYKSLYVHQISINDTQRRSGYGSQLMNRIYEMAKKFELDKIELDYWAKNEIAKNFYEKQGYVKYREFVYKNIKSSNVQ